MRMNVKKYMDMYTIVHGYVHDNRNHCEEDEETYSSEEDEDLDSKELKGSKSKEKANPEEAVMKHSGKRGLGAVRSEQSGIDEAVLSNKQRRITANSATDGNVEEGIEGGHGECVVHCCQQVDDAVEGRALVEKNLVTINGVGDNTTWSKGKKDEIGTQFRGNGTECVNTLGERCDEARVTGGKAKAGKKKKKSTSSRPKAKSMETRRSAFKDAMITNHSEKRTIESYEAQC